MGARNEAFVCIFREGKVVPKLWPTEGKRTNSQETVDYSEIGCIPTISDG
jgi:hypothetical protein